MFGKKKTHLQPMKTVDIFTIELSIYLEMERNAMFWSWTYVTNTYQSELVSPKIDIFISETSCPREVKHT